MRVYLCGPINGCDDDEAMNWREFAKTHLPPEITLVDPMRRNYRGREDNFIREIVELDKIDVASCDVILVSYSKPSDDVAMQVLMAHQLGKLVYVVADPGYGTKPLNPWLLYHGTEFFTSYAAACAEIQDKARDMGWLEDPE